MQRHLCILYARKDDHSQDGQILACKMVLVKRKSMCCSQTALWSKFCDPTKLETRALCDAWDIL